MILKQDTRRRVLLGLLAVIVYALMTNHTYLAYPNLLNVSRNPMVDPLVGPPFIRRTILILISVSAR